MAKRKKPVHRKHRVIGKIKPADIKNLSLHPDIDPLPEVQAVQILEPMAPEDHVVVALPGNAWEKFKHWLAGL